MAKEDFIRVDEWTLTEKDATIAYNGKLIIVPFDKIFNRPIQTLNTFIIKKDSYVKRLGNTVDLKTKEESKGICHYLDYFIHFYDEEKELLLSYFKLKHIIDNKEKNIKVKAFIKMMYGILFTETMQEKIGKMVEDNYYVDPESNNGVNYAEQLKFTAEHARVMMKISMGMKIMVPILFHYINTNNLNKEIPLFNFYEPLFDLFDTDIDIYTKLWITTQAKVKHNFAKNKLLWEQREILGTDPLTYMDSLLKEKIISETMFKYTFDKNIISFNSVVIDKQLGYFIIEPYEHTMVELTNKKDSEGLSGLDKLEMNSTKIDESLIILSNINIKETIKKIRESMHIDFPKKEIKFYKNFHKINKFQVQLVYYYYAKYFGGYRDLNLLTREQYLKLLVILKKRLQSQGMVYLPQILSGNAEKINKRTIQNAKFLMKIENSSVYQSLINEKFSTLEELNKTNLLLNLLSTILNTQFTLVDYDHPEKLGEKIEISNQDILSDEFLSFLNQI